MGRLAFTTQIEGFDRQVRAMLETCAGPDGHRALVTDEVLEGLSTSLEELKVAEEELAEENQLLERSRAATEAERRRYRELFLWAPDAYVLTDERGIISEANRAAAELLGATSALLVGKPLPFVVVHEDRPSFQQWLRRIQAGEFGVATHSEFRIRASASGAAVPCWFSFWRADAEGAKRHLRWVLRDLTDRESARESDWFEEQATRKDEFLAVLGHELRNPRAAIALAADLLGRELRPVGGRPWWAARTVERHTKQLTRLIDDLLDVSRVYHAKVKLNCVRVELSEIVSSAAETAQPLFQKKNHVLAMDRDIKPLWVYGDPIRLQQIVGNLLDNAAKYTPENGRIEVHMRRAGDRAILSVRDFGMGIEPAMLDRIFGLFEQGSSTSASGLGIGLTLVRELVRMHGGTIEARSDGPNHGSEFVVSLPLVGNDSVLAAEVVHPRPRPGPTAKVLIVDDNRDAADLLGLSLGARGYEVAVAYSSKEAERMAASCDLALLDLAMPEVDGFELAERLQTIAPDVELFAMTGFSDERNRAAAARAGFQHYILKPVSIADLDPMLRAAMAARAERRKD